VSIFKRTLNHLYRIVSHRTHLFTYLHQWHSYGATSPVENSRSRRVCPWFWKWRPAVTVNCWRAVRLFFCWKSEQKTRFRA